MPTSRGIHWRLIIFNSNFTKILSTFLVLFFGDIYFLNYQFKRVDEFALGGKVIFFNLLSNKPLDLFASFLRSYICKALDHKPYPIPKRNPSISFSNPFPFHESDRQFESDRR